jgi:hypothetical protein
MGMQGLAVHPFYTFFQYCILYRPGFSFSSIEGVSEDGVAQRGEVNPDLVGSTGLGINFEKGEGAESLKDLPSGYRSFPFSGSGRHPFPLDRMPSDGSIDQTFILLKNSMSNGKIDLLHEAILELSGQLVKSLIILGDDHHAGSLPVETVDDARSQHTVNSSEVFAMMEKCINQCSGCVSRSRMDNHAGWFVNHDDGGIFIQDREGEGFGFQREGFGFGKPTRDQVS